MAAAQAVGLSLGPALGGALLAAFCWRAIFWVTVPFALVASALAWVIVPKTTAEWALELCAPSLRWSEHRVSGV